MSLLSWKGSWGTRKYSQISNTWVQAAWSSQHGKRCPELHIQCNHNQRSVCGNARHASTAPQLRASSAWVTATVTPMCTSGHMKAPWNYWFAYRFGKRSGSLFRSGCSIELSTSFESVGKRHTEQQPESCPGVDAGFSRESSRWVLEHFPYVLLSLVVLMHLREVLSLCARLLQETLRCFPYAVSFLHYCQFTYVCLSSLLSSLPSKQQELHQHPLQGRAQVSSQALKGFLNLDGTFLSNYFFLYCLTQDQGTFVHPESSSESFTETGVSALLI